VSDFGFDDPREMPVHFFYRCLSVDYRTAVRANTAKQNRSICPRHWYVDIVYPCGRCGERFIFTAAEQRVWFEEYGFWIDSAPKHCLDCRHRLRDLKAVRNEYDEMVERVLEGTDIDTKRRLASLIDQLYEFGSELPARINENSRRLANEIARAER
jgi:hypothetical protein